MDIQSQKKEPIKKIYKNKLETISKMAHINNYFNRKWIKGSNQKTEWLNGYKNKTHIYVANNRLNVRFPGDSQFLCWILRKSDVGPKTFTTVCKFPWYYCPPVCELPNHWVWDLILL